MPAWIRPLAHGGALALVIGAIFLLYRPGLSGPFLFDDFANLPQMGDQNGVRDWDTFRQFVFGGSAGPLGRPLALATFLLDDNAWPSTPAAFKHTNVLLHIVAGLLLLLLVRELLLAAGRKHADWLALAAAALWLLHPMHVSTTLYVVQRMALMSALFSFAALWAYTRGRRRQHAGSKVSGALWVWGGVSIGGLLAVLSKENGALLPLLLLVLEALWLRRQLGPAPRVQSAALVLLPVLIFAALVLWGLLSGSIAGSYGGRDFTLTERLLTQPRALADYLGHWLWPLSAEQGLYTDWFVASRSFFSPPETALAFGAVILLLALIPLTARRFPALALALGFFFAAHALESTFWPLELYFEHRNYLPTALLSLPLVLGLAAIPSLSIALTLAVAWIGVTAAGLHLRAELWGNEGRLLSTWARNGGADSVRAQLDLASYFDSIGRADLALALSLRIARLHPHRTELQLAYLLRRCASSPVSRSELDALYARMLREGFDFRIQGLLEELVGAAVEQRCPGLGAAQADRLLEALERNPTVTRPSRNKPPHWRGVIASRSGDGGAALAHFLTSQRRWRSTDVALAQAARLATDGHLCEALLLLETAEAGHVPAANHLGMSGQADYSRELQRMKRLISEELGDGGHCSRPPDCCPVPLATH